LAFLIKEAQILLSNFFFFGRDIYPVRHSLMNYQVCHFPWLLSLILISFLLYARILLTLLGLVVNMNSTGEAKGVQTMTFLLVMVAGLVGEITPHQMMLPLKKICQWVQSAPNFRLKTMMKTKHQ